MRGFSNALAHELDGSNIGVTVVHPGGVATSIAKNARRGGPAVSPEKAAAEIRRLEKALTLSPARAGEIIVDAIEAEKRRVLVGSDAKLLALIERLMPVHYWSLIKRLV